MAKPNGHGRANGGNGYQPPSGEPQKTYTGRTLVLLAERGADRKFERVLGLKTAHSSDFGERGVQFDEISEQDALVLDEIGVAVIPATPESAAAVRALSEQSGEVQITEPEQVLHALASPYWAGYRDGVNSTVEHILEGGAEAHELDGVQIAAFDESQTTWGLQATRVIGSSATGRGIRVAVLDTGFDLNHPNFRGRTVIHRSFIAGEPVQDGNGHGTHCIGTACGPLAPDPLPRYGVAHEAEILAGKVLSNGGSGADGGILAGIDWAARQQAVIISMSLGAPVGLGEPFSAVYENVARRLLQRGIIIVAAAGNESRRPNLVSGVGRPANCPSILAVAAVDREFRVAPFSNGGLNPNGGAVDIAGPGRDVLSSVPMPRRTARFDGTSMATPHVAGIAALHAQSTGLRGAALWARVMQTARRLPLPSVDVGIGLVQAP